MGQPDTFPSEELGHVSGERVWGGLVLVCSLETHTGHLLPDGMPTSRLTGRRKPLQVDHKNRVILPILPLLELPKTIPITRTALKTWDFFYSFSVMLEVFGQVLAEQGRSEKTLKLRTHCLGTRRALTLTHNPRLGFSEGFLIFSTETSIGGQTQSLAVSLHFAKSQEGSAHTATGAFFKCHF